MSGVNDIQYLRNHPLPKGYLARQWNAFEAEFWGQWKEEQARASRKSRLASRKHMEPLPSLPSGSQHGEIRTRSSQRLATSGSRAPSASSASDRTDAASSSKRRLARESGEQDRLPPQKRPKIVLKRSSKAAANERRAGRIDAERTEAAGQAERSEASELPTDAISNKRVAVVASVVAMQDELAEALQTAGDDFAIEFDDTTGEHEGANAMLQNQNMHEAQEGDAAEAPITTGSPLSVAADGGRITEDSNAMLQNQNVHEAQEADVPYQFAPTLGQQRLLLVRANVSSPLGAVAPPGKASFKTQMSSLPIAGCFACARAKSNEGHPCEESKAGPGARCAHCSKHNEPCDRAGRVVDYGRRRLGPILQVFYAWTFVQWLEDLVEDESGNLYHPQHCPRPNPAWKFNHYRMRDLPGLTHYLFNKYCPNKDRAKSGLPPSVDQEWDRDEVAADINRLGDTFLNSIGLSMIPRSETAAPARDDNHSMPENRHPRPTRVARNPPRTQPVPQSAERVRARTPAVQVDAALMTVQGGLMMWLPLVQAHHEAQQSLWEGGPTPGEDVIAATRTLLAFLTERPGYSTSRGNS
ncbi:hypothetical protein BCV70DRAFT_47603 [Testicularia cyperi]|uniref:Uncharacterized protein n=1 Tax=Testicularia cyperi TaxID=1882483 RepID=A0A317XHF1_9BASI|nr:hypothetical protein BCV70DRAFT_47603 [Testicularia cyperi]